MRKMSSYLELPKVTTPNILIRWSCGTGHTQNRKELEFYVALRADTVATVHVDDIVRKSSK
jgi:hypothetical protein